MNEEEFIARVTKLLHVCKKHVDVAPFGPWVDSWLDPKTRDWAETRIFEIWDFLTVLRKMFGDDPEIDHWLSLAVETIVAIYKWHAGDLLGTVGALTAADHLYEQDL